MVAVGFEQSGTGALHQRPRPLGHVTIKIFSLNTYFKNEFQVSDTDE